MKLTMLAALAALAVGTISLPVEAATPGNVPAVSVPGNVIVPADCVWRRLWIPRHVAPNGVVIRGHWSRHRHKVCR
jgi:hypothetical protein